MTSNSIWINLEESSDILAGCAYPAMDEAAAEIGFAPDYFTWVAAVWVFHSQPFTITQFMRSFPYGFSKLNEERFEAAVRQEYLAVDAQGGYRATELGVSLAARILNAANESIAHLRPMPEDSLHRLVNLLAYISEAAFAAFEPPRPFILTHKRDLYRRMGMKDSLKGFVAHCLELEGYRDDCYISTWQANQVEGHAWEALDQLSRDGALTFDDLHASLSRRGVPRSVHAEDVKVLIQRGWVEESSGVLQITSTGRQVRAEVEAETERLFFLPWSCLNESELEELSYLATQLRNGLQTSAEE